MYKFPFFKETKSVRDTHEKPWGGVYARRLWQGMLVASFTLLIIALWVQYRIYAAYAHPIAISEKALHQEITNLDLDGLNRAVADIKEKETKFNQYLSGKSEINDPAQ